MKATYSDGLLTLVLDDSQVDRLYEALVDHRAAQVRAFHEIQKECPAFSEHNMDFGQIDAMLALIQPHASYALNAVE